MSESLLSSADVAELLGVSAASVKRWADSGVLPCERTAGHHRRFRREAIDRFRAAQAADAPAPSRARQLPDVDGWLAELLEPRPPLLLEASLLAARAELGSWWRLSAQLGPVLTELGRRWERGRLSIGDEHRASERLSRALARLGEWMPAPEPAPRCLLATAEGDEHTLGLSLVELCLRERGWTPVWIGRSAPIDEVAAAVAQQEVRLVTLSASALSADRAALTRQAARVGRACAAVGAELILGGSGAWPEPPSFGRVVRDFATLSTVLSTARKGV